MNYSLAVALGGAFGALARYWMTGGIAGLFTGSRFPWGTLSVNVLGSLLMGIVYVLASERLSMPESWRMLAGVGFLGAFTTFSAFSVDALVLLQEARFLQALAYVLGSVLLCLTSAWCGMLLARAI